MRLATHLYIGRKACGCVVAVVNDEPDEPKWTAKEVANLIKSGLTVERISFEQWRATDHTAIKFGCVHVSKPQQGDLFTEPRP